MSYAGYGFASEHYCKRETSGTLYPLATIVVDLILMSNGLSTDFANRNPLARRFATFMLRITQSCCC